MNTLEQLQKEMKKCTKKHCHDCAGCGYERPMTKGEKKLAEGLDKLFDKKE